MMKRILQTAVLTAACLAGAAPAFAAAQCNIVGNFTDTLGSTGKFTSETKGTVSNAKACPVPYHLTVTKLSKTVLDLKGKPQSGSCGALTAMFTFAKGECTTASGTVTVGSRPAVKDTLTLTGKAVSAPPADRQALTNGLH